jgi:hypothetical protein
LFPSAFFFPFTRRLFLEGLVQARKQSCRNRIVTAGKQFLLLAG